MYVYLVAWTVRIDRKAVDHYEVFEDRDAAFRLYEDVMINPLVIVASIAQPFMSTDYDTVPEVLS